MLPAQTIQCRLLLLALFFGVISSLFAQAQTLSNPSSKRSPKNPAPQTQRLRALSASSATVRLSTQAIISTLGNLRSGTASAEIDTDSDEKTNPLKKDAAKSAEDRSEARADSISKARSGIDTVVVFSAQDSIVYSAKARKMRLRKQAFVKNKGQTLEAEIIELYLDQGVMRAANARDSAGRIIGIPKFTDGKETFYGAELSYNFRSGRGTISLAETKFGEGFFFGDKVKRVNDSTFYLKDGCYTTCDKTHPHFYFKAPKMKVIMPDRIYADPLIIYFSDIPIMAIPFGLFMENKPGRRSGIMIPRVFLAGAIGDANSRGIAFEDFGYYFAINDTLDAQITGSYYTKGGWLANFKGNYVFDRRFNGGLDLSYGIGGFTPNSTPTENWRIGWRHNWEITPFTRLNGSINLSSGSFPTQTQLDARLRTQQTINSQFSINHTFDNGLPLSLNYQRVQNVATGAIDQSLNGGTNIPQIFPIRDLTRAIPALDTWLGQDSWLNDIAFSYAVSARADFNTPADSLPGETLVERQRRRDQALANPFIARISHSPSINIAPKLGYFVVSPNISYSENWYFRRIADRRFVIDSLGRLSLRDSIERGFFREYVLSGGIGINTTLYGIVNPRILGLNSLRHTLRPQISFSLVPNLQNDDNLAGRYIDTSGGISRQIVYSRFQLDGGAQPSPFQANLNWSLGNNFEAKIQQDTAEKVIQLMQVNASGSINLAADSLQWSPISVGFSNTFADAIQFSGSANFSLYDQEPVQRGERQELTTVNRFLFQSGKGLLRLTNLGFNLNYRLAGNTASNQVAGGLTASGSNVQPDTTQSPQTQSGSDATMGARFQQRLDNSYDEVDVFGDRTPGFAPLPLEWSTDFTGTFAYAPSLIVNGNPQLSALLSANLTATIDRVWRFSTNFNIDLITGNIQAPSLNLSRDLHCWDLQFRWQPFGTVQGYFFRIGIKTGQLRDVQFTRQDNRFYRQ